MLESLHGDISGKKNIYNDCSGEALINFWVTDNKHLNRFNFEILLIGELSLLMRHLSDVNDDH